MRFHNVADRAASHHAMLVCGRFNSRYAVLSEAQLITISVREIKSNSPYGTVTTDVMYRSFNINHLRL